jgi:hypothetical protein
MSDFRYPDWGPSQDPRIGNGEWATIGHGLRGKVEVIINEGINTEAHLVYFVVALRRLMDHARTGNRALKFFLDWPLHANISRSASAILVEMNGALENGETPDTIAQTIGHKLSMEAFREDLIHELMRFHLPAKSIQSMQPWLVFLQLYFRVVADIPVLSCTKKMTKLDRLAVRLSNTPPAGLPDGVTFALRINWTFTKDRDVVLEWNHELLFPTDYKPGVFYQLRGI